MTTRRAFLSVPALAGLAACTTTPPAHGVVQEGAALTCPTPTAGTVSNETGLTGLVDAYSFEQGAPYQGQQWAWLSTVPATCADFRLNRVHKGEKSIRLIQVKGWNNDPTNFTPLDYITGTFDVTKVYDGAGVAYVGAPPTGAEVHVPSAYYKAVNIGNCNYSDQQATAGTFTWSVVWDPGLPEGQQIITGSYELTFPAGTFAGDFTAPRCVMTGCPARPSKTVCVS